MRVTAYRSTVLICRSLLTSFLSIRNILAPLCQQIWKLRAPTKGYEAVQGGGKDIPSNLAWTLTVHLEKWMPLTPSKTDLTPQNICSARFPKRTKPA